MAHLWEYDHPYYCNEGNYFCKPGEQPRSRHESWADFLAEEGDGDLDMNLLFRWDWRKADTKEEHWGNPTDVLLLFWMGQRKGVYRWSEVAITDADEPAVIEFLKVRKAHLMEIWEPI